MLLRRGKRSKTENDRKIVGAPQFAAYSNLDEVVGGCLGVGQNGTQQVRSSEEIFRAGWESRDFHPWLPTLLSVEKKGAGIASELPQISKL
jgi:hypothetical protein